MKRIAWVAVVVVVLAKSALGFVGVPALLAPPVITAASGAVMSTWAAIAAGVGAALYSVGLQDDQGNEFARIDLNPQAPQIVPPGWSAGAHSYDNPVPPSSAGAPSLVYGQLANNIPVQYPSKAAACDALRARFNGAACSSGAHEVDTVTSSDPTCNLHTPCIQDSNGAVVFDANRGPFAYDVNSTCPAGYTLSGGNCALSNASQVQKPTDGRCGLKFSGGVMSYDSQDPDCQGTAPAGFTKSADGKTVTAQTPTQQIKIEVQADGSVKITHWTPSPSDPSKTIVQQLQVAGPGTPTATSRGTQSSAVNGVGDPAFQVQPTATPGNSGGFPDDYAREQTQQSVVSKLGTIGTKLDTLHQDLGPTQTTPVDPTALTGSDIQNIFFPDTFTGLKAWGLPPRSVACPTWTFSAFSHSYTINAHCSLIEDQRAFFSSIMLLVWGLIALFLVLGA